IIKSICNKKTKKLIEKPCLTIQNFLEANENQPDVELLINLTTANNSLQWVRGTIKSIQNSSSSSSNTLVVFEETFDLNNHRLNVLPLANILSLRRNNNLKTTYHDYEIANCLSIDYQSSISEKDTHTVGKGQMKYLTHGLTWAPSYNLTLSEQTKQCYLQAKTIILNDIENLQIEQLSCLVGYSNITKFSHLTDPLIGQQTVDTFIHQLKPNYSARQHVLESNSNKISNRSQMLVKAEQQDGGDDNNHNDLFLYNFKNILLMKNERLVLPIFNLELQYKDVYQCQIKPYQEQQLSRNNNNINSFDLCNEDEEEYDDDEDNDNDEDF
ncbi:unnamed protein product, partial [Didymodactylos carnosus]